ncbi:MAG: radical SAM protein [Verrucomicrobia bacterium]|nr:radical SAM protein [Verrucomicrobiota bacterium]
MKDLFLFVRPPRPLWPFNGPSSAFWPPLAFASLAAMLREQVSDLRVEILDAPALEMGWRTLESELRRRQPTYVGIGEEAVSCVEGLRLAVLAKALGARVIAGGCFFGHVAPEALRTGLIDVVVHGEGEVTLVELVQALREPNTDALRQVHGLSFLRDGEVLTTPHRAPIASLDALPMPAFDLLPMSRYGARSRNHPALAAIELGRGCVGACDFCVLWRQMGKFVGGRVVPHLRVKSPERLFEEIRLLVRQHGRRYLGWVDPSFNADPHVPGQLAALLLRHGLHIGQSAWLRTDALVRDAASGALAACVRAGLNEVYLGIERPDAEGLAALHKTSSVAHARESMRILREKFPDVLTIGSFIYGLPGDTPKTVRAIHRLAIELELDQFFFIPLTPLPGTAGWHSELWDPSGRRFREFSFLPSGRRRGHHAKLERALFWSVFFNWPPQRLRNYARGLLGGHARKRRVGWRLIGRGARLHLSRAWDRLLGKEDTVGLIFPAWYES